MKQPHSEDLLGYMLGALDAPETQQIEQSIQDNPEIQTELEKLEAMIAPLEHFQNPSAPQVGLARRTVEFVAGRCRYDSPTQLNIPEANANPLAPIDHSQSVASRSSDAPPSAARAYTTRSLMSRAMMTPAKEAPLGRGWSLTDVIVGCLALFVLAAVGIPTIHYAKFNSQVVACQENLRQIGYAMFTYQDSSPEHAFVSIPICPDDPLSVAGCYAPFLKDRGLIEDDRYFFCAAAERGEATSIPTVDQINSACDIQQDTYKRTMGGDYGYSLGYYDQGKYSAPRNRRRCNFAVLADQPSVSLPGRQSANHGGRGQNVWFEDGHIEFLSQPYIPCSGSDDAIYENDSGDCGPGVCRSDVCIGASYASPLKKPCPSQQLSAE